MERMERMRREVQLEMGITCRMVYGDYFNEEFQKKNDIVCGGYGSWCTGKTDKFSREELQLDFTILKKVKTGRVTKQKKQKM